MMFQKRNLILALGLAICGTTAHGATITVDGTCTLADAVASVNAQADQGSCVADVGTNAYGVSDTIRLPALTTLAARMPFITRDVIIEGQTGAAAGAVVDGDDAWRPFFVGDDSSSPTVVLRHLTVQNGLAMGGNGGAGGGGGGAGLGGALFVYDGDVTLHDVVFDGNQALGGYGGENGTRVASGGGGGMGGNGGSGVNSGLTADGGGGGGGFYGNGGYAGVSNDAPDGGDAEPGGFGGGGGGSHGSNGGAGGGGVPGGLGGNQVVNSGRGAGGGSSNVAGGDYAENVGGGTGASGGFLWGGGGGGGSTEYTEYAGAGGAGGFGGGGGAGGGYWDGHPGNGGNGGFGGGGGASGYAIYFPGSGYGGSGGYGGNGGFGGGGAGGQAGGGLGGNFAGRGADGLGQGGGGAGLGGAIFAKAGTLTLKGVVFSGNYAAGGTAGGASATDGEGRGGALFLCTASEDASCGASVSTGCAVSYSSNTGSTGDSDSYGDLGSMATPCVPTPASGLTATAIGTSRIDLSWTDNSDDETGFRIYRATGAGPYALIARVGANVTSYSNTTLLANTAYSYRVTAYNAAGGTSSNTATATTAVDTVRPTVTSIIPGNGLTNIPVNKLVSVSFSEPMNCTTLNATTFVLKNSTGAKVAATVKCSGNSATLTPSALLAAGKRYTASVSTGARDKAGNALAVAKSWSFTTAANGAKDMVKPTIVSASPAPNATGVALNPVVVATFSEPLDCASVTAATAKLTKDVGGTVIAGKGICTGKVLKFVPAALLEPSTGYSMTLTTGIRDLARNTLAANQRLSFTTGE